MKKKITLLFVALLFNATLASAQISVPNTFVTGGRILASEMNANFDTLESNSLNRATGTITGNISVDSGVTIDGIDIGAVLGGTGTPTFSTVTATTFTGDLVGNATGNVTGNLTGQVLTAAQTSITSIANLATVGTITSGTFSGTLGAISGIPLTGVAKLASANTYTAINKFFTYSETKIAPTISGSALTIDLSLGTQFVVSASANATITFSNPVASGEGGSFNILFTQDGTARTFTWPASVRWGGGTAYTATGTSSKVDIISCVYNNGGTTYFCAYNKNF
jgi:hypothetical protein